MQNSRAKDVTFICVLILQLRWADGQGCWIHSTALCRVKTYDDARWSSWFVKWLLQRYVVSQCWCLSLHYNSSAFSGSPPLFYLRPVSQFALSICRVESVELWLLITEIFQLYVSVPAFMPGFLVLLGFFQRKCWQPTLIAQEAQKISMWKKWWNHTQEKEKFLWRSLPALWIGLIYSRYVYVKQIYAPENYTKFSSPYLKSWQIWRVKDVGPDEHLGGGLQRECS